MRKGKVWKASGEIEALGYSLGVWVGALSGVLVGEGWTFR